MDSWKEVKPRAGKKYWPKEEGKAELSYLSNFCMLPKENRLKKEKEFETVFKGGRTVRGNDIFLKYLANGTDKTKVGFVVSKKVSKLAVRRNKIKRRMREIVRLRKKEIKEGLSIIFIALPSINDKSHEDIKKDIENLFNKGELIK